jgi:hypothetical protein
MEFFTNASTYGRVGKSIVTPRFTIRTYMLVIVYVASLTALYKIGVLAVATYHP